MPLKLKMLLTAIAVVSLLSITPDLQAAASGHAIALHGNGKGAVACSSCHGDKGQGNVKQAYPFLAGQSSHYLMKQLNDFASGHRDSPVMQGFAKALSKTEIRAVADYYAKLPLPHSPASQHAAADHAGAQLATRGKWGAGVPACFQCHGADGQGIAPNFPAISGQPQAYIESQLHAWQQGKRSNDPVGLMQAVVSNLDDKEISSVAEYLSSQAPLKAQ